MLPLLFNGVDITVAFWTNRGKALMAEWIFQGVALPTNFYIALVTIANVPTSATNVMSDLTQIATGNGYSDGGFQLSRNSTDFNTLVEDDSGNTGTVTIKDVTFTASGGALPSSGAGASYAVLTDDNVTVANRQVIAYYNLGSAISLTNGQALVLNLMKLQGSES